MTVIFDSLTFWSAIPPESKYVQDQVVIDLLPAHTFSNTPFWVVGRAYSLSIDQRPSVKKHTVFQ